MSTLIDIVRSIPDVVWSGAIASILTLGGVFISNKSNTTRLRVQLQHDATEKAKERVASLRKEVYFKAVEELTKANSHLASLPQADPTNVNVADGLQGFFAAAAKLQLVAEPKTSLLVNQLVASYGEVMLRIMGSTLPLGSARSKVSIHDNLYNQAYAQVSRILGEMGQFNETAQTNDLIFEALNRSLNGFQVQASKHAADRSEAYDILIGLTQTHIKLWRRLFAIQGCRIIITPIINCNDQTLRPTRLDYCQYLMIAQKNFTLTHFADHHPHFSHDAINRYLNSEKVTPRMMWENIRDQIVVSPRGYLVFDDSVMDKNFSHHIELVRRQYSGNAHGLIRGIGVVNCVYVNPDTSEFWPIDFRIYDIDGDGKTKLVHVEEMLNAAVADKLLTFQAVLMDGWYAKRELMLHIESLGKIYYCPLADNRLVDDSGGKLPYRRVDGLEWSTTDLEMGKLIKINKFPKNHKVKLFRVEVAKNRTDWVVTNDLGQNSLNAVQKACGMRWKIEQFHREIKQVTGVEKCQCRSARAQRNHIACAMLAWTRLKQVAKALGKTIYQVKNGLLSDYMRQELRNPTIRMHLAGLRLFTS